LQPDNQVRCEFFKQFGTKTELLENKEKWNLERAMGIEQIRMNQTKALPPAS
jgi:hypothetical protein